MKRILLLLVVGMTMFSAALAQRTVSGKVIEKDSREAVIQATVALLKADSSLVTNAVTNMNGQFQLTAPADGGYTVRITYVGFKPFSKSITISGGKPLDMGTITISPDSKMLKDVEVVKNLAKVTTKDDTIIYNAGAYRTPEGSVVEELVKKLPGAEVSDDGTITINGKQVKKVLVDGKEFMTGDTKTAIKNLPTSIVDRIKSYDEKSDLSRITGIDDGEEQTVIDFGLKRGMNRGMFANIDLGAGTKSRYSSRGMGAVMKDDFRAMVFGNANNVNDMGFPGGGGGRFGGGNRQGLTASKMIGANFNYEKKDVVKADGSIRWNHNDGDAWSRRSSENFRGTTSTFSNSLNQNYSRSNSWDAQGRVEWTPDTLWTISFRPTWSYGSNDGTSSSTSVTFNDDPYKYSSDPLSLLNNVDSALVVNSRLNGSLSYSDSKRFGGSLQINRKLGGGGRNVTLRVGANYSDGDSRSMSENTVNLYQAMTWLAGDSVSHYQTNRYNLTPQKSWDYSLRATYSEPIAKAVFLQFSYQFQYRYTKSDRSTYDYSMPPYSSSMFNFDGLSYDYRGWDSYLNRLTSYQPLEQYYDQSLSRFSQYKNYIHTGEIMFRIIRKAYNFNVGVQIIPQSSEFTYRYLTTDTVANRSVVNWSPTANFRWKISDRGQMRFEYRGRTSQPSMSQLLPITDNSNPLNISMGNADLKPSFTQSFNWRYNNFWEKHQRFIFANLNFSTTSNQVANRVEYIESTGGTISRPENISGQWNAGGRFVMNTAIDTTGYFNVNTNTSLNYDHSVGYLYLDKVTSKNYTNTTTIGERLGASYRNDWLEFELNGSVNYTHARNHLQSSVDLDTWSFGYGFNTNIQMPWDMQLHTDFGVSSRRGYNDASLNTDELLWNAQISQSFLTGKPLTVSLQFYDILHKQSNLSRSINAMSRTDNEYNAINSYAMLHVIYRLNLFGTKEARQGMRMGPGFGGPDGERRGNRGGGRGGFGGGGGRPGGGFGGGGRF